MRYKYPLPYKKGGFMHFAFSCELNEYAQNSIIVNYLRRLRTAGHRLFVTARSKVHLKSALFKPTLYPLLSKRCLSVILHQYLSEFYVNYCLKRNVVCITDPLSCRNTLLCISSNVCLFIVSLPPAPSLARKYFSAYVSDEILIVFLSSLVK